MADFVKSLNAINALYKSYVIKNAEYKEERKSKLYVEKIKEGSIDIYLCELITSAIIPFAENANILCEFAGYIKNVIEYFTKGEGEAPHLSLSENKNFSDMLTITANDRAARATIRTFSRANRDVVFNSCTFNFNDSNNMQNQLAAEREEVDNALDEARIHERQLMRIYQIRSDAQTDKGNQAIIDKLSPKKRALVFETDALKSDVLYSPANPTMKLFLVDVEEMTSEGKVVAYKVTRLHEIVDFPDE